MSSILGDSRRNRALEALGTQPTVIPTEAEEPLAPQRPPRTTQTASSGYELMFLTQRETPLPLRAS